MQFHIQFPSWTADKVQSLSARACSWLRSIVCLRYLSPFKEPQHLQKVHKRSGLSHSGGNQNLRPRHQLLPWRANSWIFEAISLTELIGQHLVHWQSYVCGTVWKWGELGQGLSRTWGWDRRYCVHWLPSRVYSFYDGQQEEGIKDVKTVLLILT